MELVACKVLVKSDTRDWRYKLQNLGINPYFSKYTTSRRAWDLPSPGSPTECVRAWVYPNQSLP